MVRAFGYLSSGVIALTAGASALVAFGTHNFDAIRLFLPLFVGYSVFIALFSIGMALYVFIIRLRTHRLH